MPQTSTLNGIGTIKYFTDFISQASNFICGIAKDKVAVSGFADALPLILEDLLSAPNLTLPNYILSHKTREK